jgi:hypothetical protein
VALAAGAAAFFVTTRHWPIGRRLTICICAAPLIIFSSYPGVFVMGGLSAALLVSNMRERSRAGWMLIGLLGLVCAVSAAVLVAGPIRAQRTATIVANWQWAFPVGLDPASVTIWFVRSVVGVADYCFRPFGGVLLVPISLGIAALWGRGERALVALFVVPLALAACAGLVGQYPFSGSRVMIYALPALAVLAAEGLAQIADLVNDKSALLRASAIGLAILPPSVLSARDVVGPWARPETASAAQVVLAARRPGELVASGNWESRYYFRALGREFVRLDEQTVSPGHRRIWCVVNGPSAEDRRRRLAEAVGLSYRIISSVDLAGISVIEIGTTQ